jgi:hypothetical protein
MDNVWGRRGLIIVGGQVFAGATLGLALERYAQAQSRESVDWRRLFATKPAGGTGKVKQITGIAFADQRSLSVGANVRAGEQLRVAKGGSLAVSIQDGTLLSLKGGTVLDFSPSTRKTGVLDLIAGALLAVMPTTNRYLVGGPTAAIGIKGTVFYREVFPEEEHTARAMEGRTSILPKGLHDYFCTCNGSVDYLRKEDHSLIASDTAEHHNSFFLNPGNPKLLEKFEMINHFDRDIKAAIELQEGPKHDASFLKL